MVFDVLAALFFAGFIFVGRWLYQHPTKMVPPWGLLNRENRHVNTLARAYAVFIIFFGLFACTGILTSRFFPGLWPVALLIVVIGTWFLRPRTLKPAFQQTANASPGASSKVALFNLHWKRYLVIAGWCAVILFIVTSAVFDNSQVSQMTFAEVKGSAGVKRRLGEPIRRGWLTSGRLSVSGPTGEAELAIPIHGPRGSATVQVVAQKRAGVWHYRTLEVLFKADGQKLDLLKAGAGANPTY